jgi:6,7-dimethyl-8-ribityllumazine synthase
MDERIKTTEGDFNARGLRFGIVASRFNDFIVDRLLDAAVSTLLKHGVASGDIEVVRVPGAFETPLAIKKLAASRRYQALIALGCVIRGGTPHFEYVCQGVTAGVGDVMRDTGVPIAFGVLTTDDEQQALDRAGGPEGNKGAEAARTAIEMVALLRRLPRPGTGERC